MLCPVYVSLADMRRSLRRFGFWGAYSDSDSFANFVTTMGVASLAPTARLALIRVHPFRRAGKVTRTWIEFNPTKGSVNPLSSVLAPLWAYATVDTFVLATHLRLLGAVSVADWWSLPPATLTEPATGILSTGESHTDMTVCCGDSHASPQHCAVLASVCSARSRCGFSRNVAVRPPRRPFDQLY